jgi:hypothetical protein
MPACGASLRSLTFLHRDDDVIDPLEHGALLLLSLSSSER